MKNEELFGKIVEIIESEDKKIFGILSFIQSLETVYSKKYNKSLNEFPISNLSSEDLNTLLNETTLYLCSALQDVKKLLSDTPSNNIYDLIHKIIH